jgi:hypothetical protein
MYHHGNSEHDDEEEDWRSLLAPPPYFRSCSSEARMTEALNQSHTMDFSEDLVQQQLEIFKEIERERLDRKPAARQSPSITPRRRQSNEANLTIQIKSYINEENYRQVKTAATASKRCLIDDDTGDDYASSNHQQDCDIIAHQQRLLDKYASAGAARVNSIEGAPFKEDSITRLCNNTKMFIKGTNYTYEAIASGRSSLTQCIACKVVLQVPLMATTVYCTSCHQVSCVGSTDVDYDEAWDEIFASTMQQQQDAIDKKFANP